MIAMSAVVALAVGSATAQTCLPLAARLTGAGGVDYFGSSTAISADGNTALIAANSGSPGIGAAYPYVRIGGVWSQQGPTLLLAGGAGAVALSTDGNTAVIGAPGDNGVYFFVRSGTTWSQQGSKLYPTGLVGSAQFGASVSLSADGNTALVGAPYDATETGAAYFFVRSGTTWSQQGGKIMPSSHGLFGISVALSADATTAMVGAMSDSGNIGAAYVYVRSGTTWSQQGPKLLATGGTGAGQFGCAVSLSGNGNAAIIGANFDNSYIGAAYIFARTGSTWTQQGSKLTPSIQGIYGSAVSMSSDGNTVLITNPRENTNVGGAYLFTRTTGGWVQTGPELLPSGGTGQQLFGHVSTQASLASDGTVIVGAASEDTTGIGAAYIFALNPTIGFTQQPTPAAVLPATTATFSVAATSAAPLTYQWRRNGSNLSNAPTGTGSVITGVETPTLTISYASYADNGSAFDCVVSNSCGSKLSDPAGLAVGPHCRADFNGNSTLEVADIFAFLNAWFAGCP